MSAAASNNANHLGQIMFIPLPGEWWGVQGRIRCCDQDFGGSHYHCGNCGQVSGQSGHFVDIRSKKGILAAMADALGVEPPFKGFTCKSLRVPSADVEEALRELVEIEKDLQ